MNQNDRIHLHGGEAALFIALLLECGLGFNEIFSALLQRFHVTPLAKMIDEYNTLAGSDIEIRGDLLSRTSLTADHPEDKALLNILSVACYSLVNICPLLRDLFENFRITRVALEDTEKQFLEHFYQEFQKFPEEPTKWVEIVGSTKINPSFRQARILRDSIEFLSKAGLPTVLDWTYNLKGYQDKLIPGMP